jgi:alpha-2-macroglobulin-like protein
LLSLVARTPGRATGPASRAWAYYADDERTWVEPLSVTVAER